MVEAKCKCGKSKMNFQNLSLEDIDGKWECESCAQAEEAKPEAKEEPKAEAPKEQPKAEEKKPRSRKSKESPKQDGEKQ
jgi:hypothetical protein